jgi:hypothetical protein
MQLHQRLNERHKMNAQQTRPLKRVTGHGSMMT